MSDRDSSEFERAKDDDEIKNLEAIITEMQVEEYDEWDNDDDNLATEDEIAEGSRSHP
ncbi:hypothetical protein BGZ83_003342, partial [Gryganskiella cystojenkinii]